MWRPIAASCTSEAINVKVVKGRERERDGRLLHTHALLRPKCNTKRFISRPICGHLANWPRAQSIGRCRAGVGQVKSWLRACGSARSREAEQPSEMQKHKWKKRRAGKASRCGCPIAALKTTGNIFIRAAQLVVLVSVWPALGHEQSWALANVTEPESQCQAHSCLELSSNYLGLRELPRSPDKFARNRAHGC